MEKNVVDRRVQRTRELLQNALLSLILEKGYDALTVQDIIDRANVGRATFYAHFQDKEDLFLSQFAAMRAQLEQRLLDRNNVNPWELVLLLFQHAEGHFQVYRALAGKQGSAVVIGHMKRFLFSLLREHLQPHYTGTKKVPVPLDVLTYYLVNSLMALLTWWLDQDLPYTPERMYAMYRMLTQPGVEAVLSTL